MWLHGCSQLDPVFCSGRPWPTSLYYGRYNLFGLIWNVKLFLRMISPILHLRNPQKSAIRISGGRCTQVLKVLNAGFTNRSQFGARGKPPKNTPNWSKFLDLILIWTILRGILDEVAAVRMTKSKTEFYDKCISHGYVPSTHCLQTISSCKEISNIFINRDRHIKLYTTQKYSDHISCIFWYKNKSPFSTTPAVSDPLHIVWRF